MRRIVLLTAASLGAASLAGRAAAQDTTRVVPADTSRTAADTTPPPRCNGETISEVVVRREEPAMIERSAPKWSRAFLRAVLSGPTTRESAVQPFLIPKPGSTCTTLTLDETERVLRSQPYLADADAQVIPDGAGRVRIEVETSDDIRPILSLSARDGDLTRFRIGNANIGGYGMLVSASWQQGFAFRDGLGARFTDYSFLGRPLLLDFVLERAPLGETVNASLSRPLYTQLQRFAWTVELATIDNYQRFRRSDDLLPISLSVERRFWRANALYRIGNRTLGTFLGAQLASENILPGARGVIVSDTGLASDPDLVLLRRYGETERTRAEAIFGVRALSFFKAQGFDALEGTQDMANGLQVVTALGKGIGSGDHDNFTATELYLGAGTPRSFVGLQGSVEAARDGSDWRDVIGSGRLAWYRRPSRRRTRVASLEYSGAWNASIPYQLAIGASGVGVRGYEDASTSGARRAVFRLEERFMLGGISRHVGFGLAGFGDVGKTWAGDVPFGETVNPRVGLGTGLLLAVPRRSRRLVRIDVATPLISDPGAKWGIDIRITSGRARFWREPGDVARARSSAQLPRAFNWP